ncbi:MAG: hypothetical protein KYX62_12185 [Pseudomonadota bacterium]|nr:hypothetical protein [Pseudomonadota bacterium]
MNANWSPITESSLLDMLSEAESHLDASSAAIWRMIRLPKPELWQQHPWGDEVCGFWVIAAFSRHCIYYNDMSDGFSLGQFSQWGRIEDYQAERLTLVERLQNLMAPLNCLTEA